MKSIKIIIAVFILLVTSYLFTFATTTPGTYKDINVFVPDIVISLNGQPVELKDSYGNPAKPFQFGGTTYLPVKCMSQLIGKDISLDPTTGNIDLHDKVMQPTGYGANNSPYLINQSGYVFYGSSFSKEPFKLKITVSESLRGQTANAAIVYENMFNDQAESGYEWMLIHVRADIIDGPKDMKAEINPTAIFSYYYYDGSEIDREGASLGDLYEDFRGNVFVNGYVDGWIPIMVKIDKEILLCNGYYSSAQSDYTYTWFKTQ